MPHSLSILHKLTGLVKQCLDKFVGVELGNIFQLFAEADEFNRYVELVFDGDDDSAARCRVAGCSVVERHQAPMKGASVQAKGGRDNLIADNIVNHDGLSIADGTATVRDNLEIAARE